MPDIFCLLSAGAPARAAERRARRRHASGMIRAQVVCRAARCARMTLADVTPSAFVELFLLPALMSAPLRRYDVGARFDARRCECAALAPMLPCRRRRWCCPRAAAMPPTLAMLSVRHDAADFSAFSPCHRRRHACRLRCPPIRCRYRAAATTSSPIARSLTLILMPPAAKERARRRATLSPAMLLC